VGAEAAALGDRILYICTPSLKDSAAAGQVRASLSPRLVAEFTGVAPHVPAEAVEAARTLVERHKVNAVVAMGGGSAIGVGKGVVAPSPKSPSAKSPSPASGEGPGGGLPLIAIPTTYAGSEMTPVYGSRDSAKGVKTVRRNPAALPRVALYDPEITLDLPPPITASTAMNALAHCVEACYAREMNPVVPPVALEGIRHIVRALPLCVATGQDLDAREDLLRGAYLAAFSIANASMALHHGLCHALGGRTGVAHGVLNAIMLPHVMHFNAEVVPDAMARIAQAMDAGARTRDMDAAARATAALLASLPVPKRLGEAGVPSAVLPVVAADAAASPTVRANPRPASEADILDLLRAAW
jgi:maleylacetate reductase